MLTSLQIHVGAYKHWDGAEQAEGRQNRKQTITYPCKRMHNPKLATVHPGTGVAENPQCNGPGWPPMARDLVCLSQKSSTDNEQFRAGNVNYIVNKLQI